MGGGPARGPRTSPCLARRARVTGESRACRWCRVAAEGAAVSSLPSHSRGHCPHLAAALPRVRHPRILLTSTVTAVRPHFTEMNVRIEPSGRKPCGGAPPETPPVATRWQRELRIELDIAGGVRSLVRGESPGHRWFRGLAGCGGKRLGDRSAPCAREASAVQVRLHLQRARELRGERHLDALRAATTTPAPPCDCVGRQTCALILRPCSKHAKT